MLVPQDIYRVLGDPVLGGMRSPNTMHTNWKSLAAMGFKWVVNLESSKPTYNCTPLFLLACVELENLPLPTSVPSDPKNEFRKICEIVDYAEDKILDGEGVLIHCTGGRGRSGVVIGGILKKLGYDFFTIINYLDLLHKRRGKAGFPESKWQSQLVENFC